MVNLARWISKTGHRFWRGGNTCKSSKLISLTFTLLPLQLSCLIYGQFYSVQLVLVFPPLRHRPPVLKEIPRKTIQSEDCSIICNQEGYSSELIFHWQWCTSAWKYKTYFFARYLNSNSSNTSINCGLRVWRQALL